MIIAIYRLTTLPCQMRCRNVEGSPFIAGSIHPQVQGVVEGRPFNISLFCFELV